MGTGEISVSLQKDRTTKPIRPYGYIIKIEKGGIVSAFDRDATSAHNSKSKKEFKPQSSLKKWRWYSENELGLLLKNTRKDYHNEIWVNTDKAEIIGAYAVGDSNMPGIKAFIKSCRKEKIEIKIVN